jgi:hypothetical protein
MLLDDLLLQLFQRYQEAKYLHTNACKIIKVYIISIHVYIFIYLPCFFGRYPGISCIELGPASRRTTA